MNSTLSCGIWNSASFHSSGKLTNLTRSPTRSVLGSGISCQFINGWNCGIAARCRPVTLAVPPFLPLLAHADGSILTNFIGRPNIGRALPLPGHTSAAHQMVDSWKTARPSPLWRPPLPSTLSETESPRPVSSLALPKEPPRQ